MSIINFLKHSKTVLFFRLLHEKWQEILILRKYIANGGKYKDKEKLRTDLIIKVHALEKGMAIGEVKVGFGQQKALALLQDLNLFLSLGGDQDFVRESCSVIKKYIIFNEQIGANMDNISSALSDFCTTNSIETYDTGGVYILDKEKTFLQLKETFDNFSHSRFSVRDFGTEKIEIKRIKKALEICEKTPSACNRQSWRVYIYSEIELRNKIFSLQRGCNGFFQNMQYAILICGDLVKYHINELSLAYVDGGMYAMNLLYALHFEGIAAIPLTMGLKQQVLKRVKKEMEVPENEVPIILIGVGSYKDTYKVAVSERYPYEKYTVIR